MKNSMSIDLFDEWYDKLNLENKLTFLKSHLLFLMQSYPDVVNN